MAGVTGLEPAASGVTGRRSNQLSYTPTTARDRTCQRPLPKRSRRSRTSPLTCQAAAASPHMFFVIFSIRTTACATGRNLIQSIVSLPGQSDNTTVNGGQGPGRTRPRNARKSANKGKMVGGEGLEPPTYSV